MEGLGLAVVEEGVVVFVVLLEAELHGEEQLVLLLHVLLHVEELSVDVDGGLLGIHFALEVLQETLW